MELKLTCVCGQKYNFDVQPVNARMPAAVACPICGADGTEQANQILSQDSSSVPPPIAVAASPMPPLIMPATTATPGMMPHRAAAPAAVRQATGEYNLGLGIVGACLGAVLGIGLMYGFFMWAHFRFPLMGTGLGLLVGFGARLLGRGTDSLLGAIAAGIAVIATAGTLYLMFGGVAGLYIMTIGISGYFAYRVAA